MGKRVHKPEDLQVESPETLSVSLVRARYHRDITSALRDGAVECLRSAGVPDENISAFDVPGSFELPQAVDRIDDHRPAPDGIIALGAVVRGDTPHFDYICSAVTQGLQEVALRKSYPVIFGVLTCDTKQQAEERAGFTDDGNNKGTEAARAFLEMIQHRQQLRRQDASSHS